jgi:hypothetical protein
MFNRSVLRILALIFGAASLGFAARGVTTGGDPGPAVILMLMALICTVAYKKKDK